MVPKLSIPQFVRSFGNDYGRLFSVGEIRDALILQWAFGAMLFYFFVTFSNWIAQSTITVEARNAAVCWPHFPNCADFYLFHALPYGYSQSIFYMLLYAVMLSTVYFMWQKRWVIAHALMMILFSWKVFVVFFLSYNISGAYDYYHIFLTATLLFVAHKEYFLKLMFVFCYFMSVTVKFSPAWIAGTYFTSMEGGAPLIPRGLTAIATNIVIFVQIVECWFLLSKHRILQRLSLAFALFFHLYSGILVFYNYPSMTLPIIAILFGPMYRYTPSPFTLRSLAGWSMIVLLALFQLLGFVTQTDRFLTLEGNRYGMFMFEANHQCVAEITRTFSVKIPASRDFTAADGTQCNGFYCLVQRSVTTSATGSVQKLRYESGTAWNRCDPHEWWSKLHNLCTGSTERIAITFDHSINGGPFYRIIDLQNICAVDYAPFKHNEWILIPPEAKIVGYPVQNWYHY